MSDVDLQSLVSIKRGEDAASLGLEVSLENANRIQWAEITASEMDAELWI